MAKVPTGLAEGRLHWIGGFAMCASIDTTYTYVNNTFFEEGIPLGERHVAGQYCRLMLGLVRRDLYLTSVVLYCFTVADPGGCDPHVFRLPS